LYIETDKWILLHAWLVPWKNIDEHTIDEITRIREYNWKPWYEFYEWKKTIIYGHWAANWLCFTKNTKWLDTGCVYWKRLTAFIWETNEVFQQSALKQRIEI
jgi:bis(5'-nucleosyl)-tetraphosphatase (symmetrical)